MMFSQLCLVWAVLRHSSLVLSDDTVIDLTHTFGKQTIAYPQNPAFNFSNVFRLSGFNGYVAEGNAFQAAEHSGTHVDAPRHFCPPGKFMNEISMNKLSGPGVVFDFKAEAEVDRDFEVSVHHLHDWEKMHGTIPDNSIMLFNFGWEKFWPNRTLVFNTDKLHDTTTFHFPGLSPDAAKWLTANRKLHAVGSDTPSIDYGQTSKYETHAILLCENEVVILENVANLDAMPPTGTKVYIGALKLENGSGTPVRLFAVSLCDVIHVQFSLLLLSIVTLCNMYL